MTKHTPGPWQAEEVAPKHSGANWVVYPESDDGFICHVSVDDDRAPSEVAANAHLIAAAPDLYQFAVDVFGWLKLNDLEHLFLQAGNQAVLHGRNAIAKAEGN
jgi:hypothetical protein